MSNLPQIMPTGGQVVAVVPQSIEEIFRVSKGVVQSGLAPYALTGKTETEADVTRATSAVAIVIMAGAELGLPPMVALRSFTAINGRPALYGDGLINVVRRSKMAKRIQVGFTPSPGDDPYGDTAVGYCEAERIDSGETKRIEFSVRQAKRAGLWQPDDRVWKDVWSGPKGNRTSKREQVPNDSPWYRYPERMLGWRAAGFCLRELFGDVLGGITDDWEAREISGMVDVTPSESPRAPVTLPDVPPDDEPEPDPTKAGQKVGDAEPGAAGAADAPAAESPVVAARAARDEPPADMDAYFARIEEELEPYDDEEEFLAFWAETGIEAALAGDSASLDRAEEIRRKHLDRIEKVRRADAVEAGQGDIFGGGLPDVPGDDQ